MSLYSHINALGDSFNFYLDNLIHCFNSSTFHRALPLGGPIDVINRFVDAYLWEFKSELSEADLEWKTKKLSGQTIIVDNISEHIDAPILFEEIYFEKYVPDDLNPEKRELLAQRLHQHVVQTLKSFCASEERHKLNARLVLYEPDQDSSGIYYSAAASPLFSRDPLVFAHIYRPEVYLHPDATLPIHQINKNTPTEVSCLNATFHPDTVDFIMEHEFAHLRNVDSKFRFFESLICASLTSAFYGLVMYQIGIPDTILKMGWTILSSFYLSAISSLFFHMVNRAYESRADREAIEILGNTKGIENFCQAGINLGADRFNHFSHPSDQERLEAALQWKKEHERAHNSILPRAVG